MTQKEINNILDELNNGKFHIECPSCYEEVNLKRSWVVLFGSVQQRSQVGV